MVRTDTVVVGAGPIGLELAAAFKGAGVDYIHLEAGQIGQTISWYPRQVRFFSSPERIAICGLPLVTPDQSKASREEYLAYLRGVVQHLDLKVRTYERVTAIERREGGFRVRTEHRGGEGLYECDRVVLAVGDMHRPRKLGIPGEDLPHVSHYFEEPHRFFHQKLMIVGGRNSAVEAAIRCCRAGAEVLMSYRGEAFDPKSVKYWLLPEIQSMIRDGQITFHPGTVPVEIMPRWVRLGPAEGAGEAVEVPADFVLMMTGYEMDTTLFEMAGVELVGENRGPRFDPKTMQTNVPGLYVAGTAAAGTQRRFRLFIENCHVHVRRIVASITGDAGFADQLTARQYELPES